MLACSPLILTTIFILLALSLLLAILFFFSQDRVIVLLLALAIGLYSLVNTYTHVAWQPRLSLSQVSPSGVASCRR